MKQSARGESNADLPPCTWRPAALPLCYGQVSRGGGIRTRDLTVPNRARCQLRYTPSVSLAGSAPVATSGSTIY